MPSLLTFLLVGLCTAVLALCAAVFVAALSWLVLIVLAWREQAEDWPRAEARDRWPASLKGRW